MAILKMVIFPLIVDFPMKNGDFPIKNGDFPEAIRMNTACSKARILSKSAPPESTAEQSQASGAFSWALSNLRFWDVPGAKNPSDLHGISRVNHG